MLFKEAVGLVGGKEELLRCQASLPTHLVLVEAGLQAGGHAVGTLVALPNPPPSLAVFDADGCDACRMQ